MLFFVHDHVWTLTLLLTKIIFPTALPVSCNPGFYGDDCKIPCPVNCLEHVRDVSGGTCGNCSHGWTGSFCDIREYHI